MKIKTWKHISVRGLQSAFQLKKASCEDRVLQVEEGFSQPLVILTTGGTGPCCTRVIKKIAGKIADKTGETYIQMMNFVRTRLRFAILCSVIIALRGSWGKVIREARKEKVAFNLIPCHGFPMIARQ